MTPGIYAFPAFVEHVLRDAVDEPGAIDPHAPLRDQVVDSIVFVELCVTLDELGVDLRVVDPTTHLTLDDLYNAYVDVAVR